MSDHQLSDAEFSVFVYGTLKRGQCRAQCWPHTPVGVRDAKVQGELFDLGMYPAMRLGSGWVGGELWVFSASHETDVLRVLDRIEGFAGAADDLYQRVRVPAHTGDSETLAWTYVFREKPASRLRIPGDPATWPV